VVDTPHGRIQALGTRFIVRLEEGATRLTMIESRTSVQAGPAGMPAQTLEAGQQARLTPEGLQRLEPVSPGVVEDAFRLRRLVVQDMPMAEVLDELARHRDGLLRYDRHALEGLRVSAVLPLDDTGRALQLLVDSFPQLRVRTLTRWAVWVDASS
jgi:transmembrane sensor